MTRSTKLLCVFYALLAVGALVATWSRNLEFFAVSYVVLSLVIAISAVLPIFLIAREVRLARSISLARSHAPHDG